MRSTPTFHDSINTLMPVAPPQPPPSQDVPENWDQIISPKTGLLDLHLSDIWRYRDLLLMFVRRDFVAVYKQTVLGPIWFFIQPLLTTTVFTVVFSGMAKLPTAGQPPVLFYLAGITAWNYFATCLTKTSTTFTANANLFGKVYFPRLITPLSVATSSLIQFGIQFILFLAVWAYFTLTGSSIHPSIPGIFLLTPVLLAIMGLYGLGCGIIISSLTTKYRDLQFLVSFGVQLLMYGTPVIYSLNSIPEKYHPWIAANPMTPIIECFRGIYLGDGSWSAMSLIYSTVITLITVFAGLVLFNRVEKTFMDSV